MSRRGAEAGYAMLAALLVTVLAAAFALVAVAAVQSVHAVEGADAGARRAELLESRAVAELARRLRWAPAGATGAAGGDAADGTAWEVTWAPAAEVPGAEWPRVDAAVVAASGRARLVRGLTLELRCEPWAAGVTCTGDAELAAEVVVAGSGVCVGGCLRGRENLRFASADAAPLPDGRPADLVHGELFPAAAAHGGVGIYARGAEIHAGGAAEPPDGGPADEFPDDTDRHAGLPAEPGWLEGPTAEFLAAAALEAGSAPVTGGGAVLRLDELPPAAAGAGGDGRCLLLGGADEVVLEGALAPAAGRLLLVVDGDAVAGRPGAPVELSGGLVVRGRLTVVGGLRLTGPLHAGALSVAAPTRIVVPADWRRRPLPGAAVPVVVRYGD